MSAQASSYTWSTGTLVGVQILYRQIDHGTSFPASPPREPRLRVVS